MKDDKKGNVLVIVGQTASGKTELSLELAKKFDGEIISADSRQVYTGLDIGTEKIAVDRMQGIKHYLIDVCDPKDVFSVQEFKIMASRSLKEIVSNGKLPIIVGGTGFYIDALIYDIKMPEVRPNALLRKKLEAKSAEELYEEIEKKDPERANAIDPNNKRRLIRALEIIDSLGKVPNAGKKKNRYNTLVIGIQTDSTVLKKRIEERLDDALMNGLVKETALLLSDGVPRERMRELGLEYRIALNVIEGTIPGEKMKERMLSELFKYAKRQSTWFKRNSNISWFGLEDKDKIIMKVSEWLGR